MEQPPGLADHADFAKHDCAALRACLSRYSGPMGTDDVEIGSPDESDDVESAGDGSERRLFVRRLDFEVWHAREPVR